MKHADKMRERIARMQAFYAGNEPGDLTCSVNGWGRYAILEQTLCNDLNAFPVTEALEESHVDELVTDYVRQLRTSFETVYEHDDDVLPCAEVYWGIGGITAAISGREPIFSDGMSWCEPNLSWEEIDALRLDPDDRWSQYALRVNRILWREWDEDYLVLPFLHRSPLDAANGLRGTELFTEMYAMPDRVKALIDWCADWSIAMESFLYDNTEHADNWGAGVWGTWLPPRGVFVNGDPVGMISRDMQQEFEAPYTAKLFTATGGGFFHNHAIGMHQVDLVAQTPGTVIHQIGADPNVVDPVHAILHDPEARERILESSLHAPLHLNGVGPEQIDEILPILKHGRFYIAMVYWEGHDPAEMIAKVRKASNLD